MSKSSGSAGPVTGSSGAGVSIGTAVGSSAGVSGGAGEGKGSGAPTTGGGVKAAGVSIGLVTTGGGGSLGAGVASATGAGKSAGISAARTGMSTGTSSEKSATGGGTSEKTAGMDSVVSPLIGAGANVYIMTNELTQSMREKLGTSWPFVQDTLNSRYAKLLAGGLLASVAFIVVWKIIKRFSAKAKAPPESEDEESYQWNTAKTYELTPVSEGKRQQGPRSEGDGYTLPAKIQLRIADTTLQGNRPAPPEICKARDAATRHRHTRHLLQGQGEQTAADSHSPWHSEQPGNHCDDLHCSCPSDLYGSLPPQPRLLYSVNESHSERRAMNMPHAHVQDLLTYASSPPTLCPTALGSGCPHTGIPKPCCLYQHTGSAYTPHINLAPTRMSEGASWLASHHHPMFHSQQAAVNLMNPYHVQSYLSHQHGNMQSPFRPSVNAGINYISVPYNDGMKTDVPWPCSLSMEKAQTMTSASSVIETAGRQTPVPDMYSSSQTVESRARSVSQQTDGQPVDEDLDMPAHINDTHHSNTFQMDHNQKVPTRTAQSHVTPSQCTNTPLRTDHSQLHVHGSLTFPSHLSSIPQTILPTVYQTPQGTLVQLSASGECPAPYSAVHHNSNMHFHTQHPAILDTYGARALPAPSLLQPLPYHHVSVSSAQQPSLGQQKQTAKLRQQHQQPVVQHPSDSSVSQNSSEPNTIQDSRQYEGSHPTTGSQETTGPEELSQEPYNRIGAGAPVFLPRDNPLASGLRAVTDYSQSDHPWLRAQGVPGYQPTPLCVLGYQSSNTRNYSPLNNAWSAPTSMFMTPSPNLFVSSPAGMMVTSSPQLVQSTASPWQAPYLYPQTHLTMPRQAGFNPNFNLSNSNPQFFMQDAGQNTMQMLPPSQEPSKVTVIGSDHSINSNNAATSGVKTSVTAVSMSEVSLSTVATEAPEVTSRACQVSAPAPAYNVQNLQSGDALVTELAATDEKSHLIPPSATAPENPDHFHHTEAKPDLCSVFQTDPHGARHTEVTPSPSGSTAGSASNEAVETQI